MSDVWNWIVARLKEPSTWAGLGLVASAVGSGLASGESWTQLLGGILSTVVSEKS